MITVSIVSHGHGDLLWPLLDSLIKFPEVNQIILTFNIPERLPLRYESDVILISNSSPKGFGENQNLAFRLCDQEYFCVINPDIFLDVNPFPALIANSSPNIGVLAPMVVDSKGVIQENARFLPTPIDILFRRAFLKKKAYTFAAYDLPFCPQWIAGMFMFFSREAYQTVAGFDEKFYLYVEDVDICLRLWRRGLKVMLDPRISIGHNARRDSHKKFKYFFWHVTSLFYFYWKYRKGFFEKSPPRSL